MRDAITLLEQVAARYGPNPTFPDVLAALGLVEDERSPRLVRAILEEDLAEALEISREVADDGIDIARFTRATLDIMRRLLPQIIRGASAGGAENPEDAALVEVARTRGTSVHSIVTAIQELAKADFRLDPASAVPLEMACAAAILQPTPQVVVATAPPSAGPGQASGTGQQRPARGASREPSQSRDPGPASPEERFLRQLYDRCSMANVKVGAWLNGSCEVLSLGEDTFELGFFHDFHLEKVTTDGRAIIEQQAEIILGRPMRLEARRIDRDKAASAQKRPRGGHLAEAAVALGATPVARE